MFSKDFKRPTIEKVVFSVVRVFKACPDTNCILPFIHPSFIHSKPNLLQEGSDKLIWGKVEMTE